MISTYPTADSQRDGLTDAELWADVVRRSVDAFEEIVRRHQAVVAAVAFSASGDLASSEDIAQEAFLVAWQSPDSLSDPNKLRPWLCGIARNLARNSQRREARSKAVEIDLKSVEKSWQKESSTVQDALVSREEQLLVWQALEQIPENYREPLVLFYREEQSVTAVADALELSEDAVRQRLSRGRELLRHQVTELIEGTLRRTRPTAAFTVSVMAGLAAISSGSKVVAGTTVTAAGASAAKSVSGMLAGGSAASVAGGLAGATAGLAGGWLGSWIPAQLAPTNQERLHLLKVGKRMLLVTVAMTLILIAMILLLIRTPVSTPQYLGALFTWMVLFQTYVGIEVVFQIRTVRKIRAQSSPDSDPNLSAFARKVRTMRSHSATYEGRVYVSPRSLLGRPLVHFNVSDPQHRRSADIPPRKARGWIAVGDQADGWLLAVGGTAKGLIAIGGRAAGVISFGGAAFGMIAIGGLSLGLLSIGGLALGGFAVGGAALGWQAAGGGAAAWDYAAGGAAVAVHSAYGGAAIARDIAVGGAAFAERVNVPADRVLLGTHWMVHAMNWMSAHNAIFIGMLIVVVVAVNAGLMHAMYRRRAGA